MKKLTKRYAMAVDTRRCVGCNACVLACKAENNLDPGAFRSWITSVTTGKYPDLAMEIRSERCNHCGEAACVSNCPTGASYYAQGGLVLVDKDRCTGCKACIAACPYEARYVTTHGVADKCTLCVHRIEKGQQPACASNCPTRSLTFGDINDPDSEISKLLRTRQHKTLEPERGTKPYVFYLI